MGDRGIVGRLGGDEFAMLLPALVDPAEAHATGNDLVRAFGDPLKVREYEILMGIGAGMIVGLDAASDAFTMLKNADLAPLQGEVGWPRRLSDL